MLSNLEITGWKKFLGQPNLALRNFLNSIISKLDKNVVLLLIIIAGFKPDFLACYRREILYTWTRPFVVETKAHFKI